MSGTFSPGGTRHCCSIEVTHNEHCYRIYRNTDGRLWIDRGEGQEGGTFSEEAAYKAIAQLFDKEF